MLQLSSCFKILFSPRSDSLRCLAPPGHAALPETVTTVSRGIVVLAAIGVLILTSTALQPMAGDMLSSRATASKFILRAIIEILLNRARASALIRARAFQFATSHVLRPSSL
jgi:hypothetical protein